MQKPLAYKMRPTSLEDVIGQAEIIGPGKIISNMIENNTIFSMILFGPPGTGKTTIARLLPELLKRPSRFLNAVIDNKKDIENVIYEARMFEGMILIIDEVHRLNKDKQDILLPHIETGLITLIGATTANPYHAINTAIRSRCHLIEVKPLEEKDIYIALKRAMVSESGLNNKYNIDDDALILLSKLSGTDLRFGLNKLEIAALSAQNNKITKDTISSVIKVANTTLDKDESGHYDAISALQKSIRGSDVNASLYYLARLIAYEDMESIERRLLITAYEDIGLANPQAVDRTINAINSAKNVGFPEAAIPLGFAVIDLALSPKSKSSCKAIFNAVSLVKTQNFDIPPYLKLSPVGLSENDKYDYDNSQIWDKIQYLPNMIKDMKFYDPPLTTGPYEQSLIKNYQLLEKITRTNNIASLKNVKR